MPLMLKLSAFPQLRLIAWNRSAGDDISEDEAFALYEANWQHLDQAALHLAERQLIERLTRVHGRGLMNV